MLQYRRVPLCWNRWRWVYRCSPVVMYRPAVLLSLRSSPPLACYLSNMRHHAQNATSLFCGSFCAGSDFLIMQGSVTQRDLTSCPRCALATVPCRGKPHPTAPRATKCTALQLRNGTDCLTWARPGPSVASGVRKVQVRDFKIQKCEIMRFFFLYLFNYIVAIVICFFVIFCPSAAVANKFPCLWNNKGRLILRKLLIDRYRYQLKNAVRPQQRPLSNQVISSSV